MVKKLVISLEKSKALPLCPYVFHLYFTHNAIRSKDKKAYLIGELMLKHNVKPDEEEPVGLEDLEQESLDVVEIAKLQA